MNRTKKKQGTEKMNSMHNPEIYLNLKDGSRYEIECPVLLCPSHTDDFYSSVISPVRDWALNVGDAGCLANFLVKEVRVATHNKQPWYLLLSGGEAGWVNSAALAGKRIFSAGSYGAS